ncbi:hypothetical protein Leryth_003053 [Lithospermum erythrorhizon]|nr:hypothetical protein Leryth_003053 [Lithospermum erythrorhizon]
MPGHNTLFRKHVSHIFVMLRNTKEQRSMVWRHCCLCCEGQKLINDKACIGSYGIKDGDQLQFIRHMTIDQKPAMKQFGNVDTDAKTSMYVSYNTLVCFSSCQQR